MNTRVVGVVILSLLVLAQATDPQQDSSSSSGSGDKPNANANAAADKKGKTKPKIEPTVETFRPEMYPRGFLRRQISPPRIGLNQADYRGDVQYHDGGRPPTPEQAFARARAIDPRVTADVTGPRRYQYTTPRYEPETVWDVMQMRGQQRRRQPRVPVDVIPEDGRRGGRGRGRRNRRRSELPPLPPQLPPLAHDIADLQIPAYTVYDAPASNVRMVPRRPRDGRVEAEVVADAQPRRVRRTVPVTVHEQPRTFSSNQNNVVIVGDIKQWVDNQLQQPARTPPHFKFPL